MKAPLSGTGRPADDLYLVAHHEITGKPHLQLRALGLGVTAGLLGELMLPGAIYLTRGPVMVGEGPASCEQLTSGILTLIGSEREDLGPRDWLFALAPPAQSGVASIPVGVIGPVGG